MRAQLDRLEALKKDIQPSALTLMKTILAVLEQAIIQVRYMPHQDEKETAQVVFSGDQQVQTLEALEEAAQVVLDEWFEVINVHSNRENNDE